MVALCKLGLFCGLLTILLLCGCDSGVDAGWGDLHDWTSAYAGPESEPLLDTTGWFFVIAVLLGAVLVVVFGASGDD